MWRAACSIARISAWAVGSAQLALVAGRADDLALERHDGADRHVALPSRAGGLAQREAHEVLVSWEVVVAPVARMPGKVLRISEARADTDRVRP